MPIRMGTANPARSLGRAEHELSFVTEETARRVYDLLIEQVRRQSELRRNGWESANLAGVTTISTSATTSEELRATFVYTYCTSIATLQLGSVIVTLPAGANVLPLGDDQYGGVILSQRDPRTLTATGAAATMSLFVSGEIIQQTGRN